MRMGSIQKADGFSACRGQHAALSAFTLVELLVVVAIIAILAGIALPNFLEAQTRSKVARVKSDLRTISGALATYAVDHRKYPPSALVPRYKRMLPLTTPIAYITSVPLDYFNASESTDPAETRQGHLLYSARPIDTESRFLLVSDGPDRRPNYTAAVEFYPGHSDGLWDDPSGIYVFLRYDPTNGSVSVGDIFRASDYIMP